MKQHNPLGRDPLAQGIFTKTEVYEEALDVNGDDLEPETINQKPEYGNHKPETINQKLEPEKGSQEPEARNHKPETGFLLEGPRDKITFQFPVDLNEWIDDLVRNGKKRHGHKIQKQTWFQAAIELMKTLPVNWEQIESTDQLREELEYWANQLKSLPPRS